jgi:hypothetical protein
MVRFAPVDHWPPSQTCSRQRTSDEPSRNPRLSVERLAVKLRAAVRGRSTVNGLFDGASTSLLHIFGLVASGPATPILAMRVRRAVVWNTSLTRPGTHREFARAVADLEFVRAISIRLALEQACCPGVDTIPASATKRRWTFGVRGAGRTRRKTDFEVPTQLIAVWRSDLPCPREAFEAGPAGGNDKRHDPRLRIGGLPSPTGPAEGGYRSVLTHAEGLVFVACRES